MNNINVYKKSSKQRGAALLLFVLFFMVASTSLAYVFGRVIYADITAARLLSATKVQSLVTEAAAEDMAYRYVHDLTVANPNTLTLNDISATVTGVVDSATEELTITATSTTGEAVRVSEIVLSVATGVAFNYGIQTGNGGFSISNSARVNGNVFANGPIEGGPGSSRGLIVGDLFSAGPAGSIYRMEITGDARANSISSSVVGGSAYFQSISGTSVGGSLYSGSPNLDPIDLPISNEMIDEWQQAIVASGTVITAASPQCSSGTYTISSSQTLGNVKIECDLVVRQNSTTLTLTDNVWVQGNISFTQGPTVRVDAGLGNRSVVMIADEPTSRASDSRVVIANGTNFYGSGDPRSFVMLLSRNNSAASGGSTVAISIGQSSAGKLILYAAEGAVTLANSISLKEVTAYRITLGNNTEVTYESGLANPLFTSGPGAGYRFLRQREVE
jgi:hypothetical protein